MIRQILIGSSKHIALFHLNLNTRMYLPIMLILLENREHSTVQEYVDMSYSDYNETVLSVTELYLSFTPKKRKSTMFTSQTLV